MSKLFLVQFGLYEDKWPSGVFTTRELAERFVTETGHSEKADWDQHASIYEIELDPTAESYLNPQSLGMGWLDASDSQ